MDAISRRYADAGVQPDVYLAFPLSLLESQLESLSLQLWHKAPDQYQESDRLRAEAGFRVGVALPIATLGIVLGAVIAWWISLAFALGALVLVMQARLLRRERLRLLANALEQGLADSAILSSTARFLSKAKVPARATLPLWHAATAVGLNRAGSTEGHEMAIFEGVNEISQELDFGTVEWKDKLDDLMDGVRSIFEAHNDPEGYEFFERMVAEAQQRAEAALAEFDNGSDADDTPDFSGRRAWNSR
ncbi:hypothetical protein ASD13_06135 [Microbacterium sp. Root1433D1]|nr:hypothetical protein ASD13_06135 [Microbacterium sp. Root1433D1]